jgi:hypothetical protein
VPSPTLPPSFSYCNVDVDGQALVRSCGDLNSGAAQSAASSNPRPAPLPEPQHAAPNPSTPTPPPRVVERGWTVGDPTPAQQVSSIAASTDPTVSAAAALSDVAAAGRGGDGGGGSGGGGACGGGTKKKFVAPLSVGSSGGNGVKRPRQEAAQKEPRSAPPSSAPPAPLTDQAEISAYMRGGQHEGNAPSAALPVVPYLQRIGSVDLSANTIGTPRSF